MLDGYKTYLAALAAVLIAVGVALQQYVEGSHIEWNLVIQAIIALAVIFLRKGISHTAKRQKINTPSEDSPISP